MPGNNKLVKKGKDELLNIFLKEEDKHGYDILAMSDFYELAIEKIASKMNIRTKEFREDIDGIAGEIAAAINCGYDIAKSRMLVADSSHFGQDIIDGLKEGRYHVGQSREVAGNFRPAVLDDKEHIVKFFTLKKAINPLNVLSDISTLSMQALLQRISSQIEEINRGIQYLTDLSRREALSNKFLCSRDVILQATGVSGEERESKLDKADDYLREGLVSLYSDVNALVEKLAQKKFLTAKIKDIDTILSYINEDMQLIPRYVGMRVYLFNYRGMVSDLKRILSDYKHQLRAMTEVKVGNSKFTAFELIHKYYSYNEENIDFWLEKPIEMVAEIDSYEKMLEQQDKDIVVLFIEAEAA